MTPDELVGLTGLEQMYQCSLAGTPGQELIEVDTSGKMVRILGKRDPIARDLT
jgi:cell division protein FtsI/penicillin-binding protein 2